MPQESERWLDLGPEQRRALFKVLAYALGFALAAVTLFGTLLWTLLTFDLTSGGPLLVVTMVSGVACVATLCVLGMIVVWLPRFLTHQGVEFGDHGLRLVQRPRGWFRGRTVELPWDQVWSLEPGRGRSLRGWTWLVLHLRDVAASARPPHWALLVPADGEPPRGEPRSTTPRLFLQLHRDTAERFTRLLESHRSRTPPASRPGPRPVGPGEDRAPLRRTHRVVWLVMFLTALTFPVLTLGSLAYQDGLAALDPRDPVVVGFGAVGAAGVLAALLAAPWQWARQTMVANDRGVGVHRERLWWARERRGFVRWDDILGCAVREMARGPSGQRRPVLELYLTGLDGTERFPGWVRRARAGEPLWGESTDVARLVVPLVDPRDRSGASHLIRRFRPALFDRDRGGFAGPRVAHWIPVRRRWVFCAVLVSVVPITLAAGLGVGALATGRASVQDWGPPLVLAAVGIGLGFWLLPPLRARQGIRVDDDGLDLVQRPLLWFRGRHARVRWEHVRAIRQARTFTLSGLAEWGTHVTTPVTDLLVDRAHAPTNTPTWARTSGGEEGDVVRIRLNPGAEHHPRLADALRGRVG